MNIINLTVPTYPYLVVAGSALYRPGDYHQSRHSTGVFDLIYVERGEMYLTENDIPYTVRAGEYLILSPTGKHYSHKPASEQTLFHWLHFMHDGLFTISSKVESAKKGKSVEEYTNIPLSKLDPTKKSIGLLFNATHTVISLSVHGHLNEAQQQEFLRIHKVINSAITNKYEGNYTMTQQPESAVRFQQMFLRILEMLQLQPEKQKSNKLADGIMDYLVQNYYQDISLRQLSELFNFHSAHIIRTFKKEYGITPIEALNNVRISKAMQLLTTTSMTTTEIASSVGYSTSSYFARIFKKSVGLTPQAYRSEEKERDYNG